LPSSTSDRRRFKRIAQIAPLAESVPPKLYGGTERVVAWLVDELIELGHDVTLFASGDSRTRAALAPAWPRALRLGRPRSDPVAAQAVLLECVAERAAEFDVIHSHIDWLHLPLLTRLGIPFVTTAHGRLDLPQLDLTIRRFPDAPFISISDNQRVPLAAANWISTVYHGMPPHLLQPSFASGSYLAFLGRLTAEKGPEVAIRIARTVGLQRSTCARARSSGPTTTLHRVEPVTRGMRVAAFGWVRSFVRSAERREILFDLETARRDLFEREGKTQAVAEADEAAEADASGEQERIAALEAELSEKKRRCPCIG
jgi:hypothetical protein